MFKKALIPSVAAAMMALAAGQASAVLIDTAGGGGSGTTILNPTAGSAVFNALTLDWKPDNALAIGALSTPPYSGVGAPPAAGQAAGETYFQTVAQGALGSFGTSAGNVAVELTPGVFLTGREFTFQTSFFEFASGIGGATSSFRLAPGASYFRIYADTAKDHSDITGQGYGIAGGGSAGTLILEGTIQSIAGSFTDKTRLNPTTSPNTLIDGFGADDQNGVLTHQGEGSNKIGVDITFLNSAYFLGDVDTLELTLNYTDTTNLTDPFITVNPSDAVVGVVPSYAVVGTDKVNGELCSTAGGEDENGVQHGRCDFHFQSDASGAFGTVPEPGSLALVGAALGLLGFASRRKA